MSPQALVVGAAFADHQFHSGQGEVVELDGVTTPWNTLALWHTQTLALIGFIGLSEGVTGVEGGVEEVATIATLQHLLQPAPVHNTCREEERAAVSEASRTEAKLVRIPGLSWSTGFEDEERRKWHERKMRSKVERPAKQLSLLPGLPRGTVRHLDMMS